MGDFQKRGEGRVVIGLPARLEKTQIALSEAQSALSTVQSKLTQVGLIVDARPVLGDELAMDEIRLILRGENV